MQQSKTQNLKLIGTSMLFLTVIVVALTIGYFSIWKISYNKTTSKKTEQKIAKSNLKSIELIKLKTQLEELIININTKLTNLKQKNKGNVGLAGPQGAKGPQGNQGETGEQGQQGNQGKQGKIGDVGQQGAKGPQGQVGRKGLVGVDEVKGSTGEQGARGKTGTDGLLGLEGDKGEDGDAGAQGAQGEQGKKGIEGIKGKKGVEGAKGKKGIEGVQGKKGKKGPKGSTPDTSQLEAKVTSKLIVANFLTELKKLISTNADPELITKFIDNVIKPVLTTMYFENWVKINKGKFVDQTKDLSSTDENSNKWWKMVNNIFKNLKEANNYLFKHLTSLTDKSKYGLYGEIIKKYTNATKFKLLTYSQLTLGKTYQRWNGFHNSGTKKLSSRFLRN